MSAPPFPPDERAARETYLSLMQALSFPGTSRPWPTPPESLLGALARVGEALLDAQTTFHSVDPQLRRHFVALGAVSESVRDAEFLFAHAEDPDLNPLAGESSVGTWMAPESSATLVVAVPPGNGALARLNGPGIASGIEVELPRLSSGFWEIRFRRIAYPLGWDLFIVDTQGVMGIPRTTEIRFL